MAQFIINIKDEDLKTQIEDAFVASYANPDSISSEELVIKHISNFILHILNDKLVNDAVEAAKAAVEPIDSLE